MSRVNVVHMYDCLQISSRMLKAVGKLQDGIACLFKAIIQYHQLYHELLSSSMGLSSEQVISDASLNHACRIAMKDYLRTELKEDSAASSVEKSRTYIVFRRFGKAVAVAAITITLLFSTAMVANAQFREKVIAWVVETFEKYSIFELQSDGENTQPDLQSYKPTYLPNGAELKNTVEQPEMIVHEYVINESSYFNILLSKADTWIYADAENAKIESFDKDGVIKIAVGITTE